PAVQRKPPRVTKEAVAKAIAKRQGRGKDSDSDSDSDEWDFATGHSGSGMWPPEVTVTGEHSFKGDRVRQVLRHLSTMMFYYAKSLVDAEQEVQAMLVNDRIFVSSNDQKSMAKFKALQPKDLFEILLGGGKLKKIDDRTRDDMHKLRA